MSISVELARAARLQRRHGGHVFKFMDVSTRRRRQLAPSEIRPAVAEGWELHFSLPGIPYIEPSFAALRRGSNVSTHGVCLELDRESWLRLLVSEGGFGLQSQSESGKGCLKNNM